MANLDTLVELIGEIEYGDDIPAAANQLAETIGAAIIYGYSDDGVIADGVVEDQGSAYEGNTLWLDRKGFLPINEDLTFEDDGPTSIDKCRELVKRFDSAVKVKAIWHDSGVAWTYEFEGEHRTFEIKEDGEVWCKGIVFLLPE